MPLHILQDLPAPQPDNTLATAVARQFAGRPTLRSASAALLGRLLREYFPGLGFDLEALQLFVPEPEGRSYHVRPLIDAALDNLCQWEPLQLHAGALSGFLGDASGVRLKLDDTALDPDTLREVIKVFADGIVAEFQQALMNYWQARGSEGVSRLSWLARTLAQALAPHAAGTQVGAGMLGQVLQWPRWAVRQARGEQAVRVYLVQVQLDASLSSTQMLLSDLVMVCADQVLRCTPAGQVSAHASLEAFGQVLTNQFEDAYRIVGLQWQLLEIEGNPFMVQAEALLDQQLRDVQALRLSGQSVAVLEGLFATVSDVAARLSGNPAFVPTPADTRMLEQLPAWLRQASGADYLSYRMHWLDMALAHQRTAGKAYDHDLPTLRDYAAQVLRERMLADQPHAPAYDPYTLVLTFEVPYGQGGFGFVETVRLLLVDAALENLSGLPKGPMHVAHADGDELAAWLTPDYLLQLIAAVDIGASYLALIEQVMRSDPRQAAERRQLFADTLRAQLPLLALECKIKGEQGFTRQGVRCVDYAMSNDAAERVEVRPLTFLSGEGASPDTVDNMFVFALPGMPERVLYRPLFEPLLREFASEAALFAALKEPELEASVLSWMGQDARRVYAHGGFAEPHLGGIVDDPTALPGANVPRLGGTALTGDLLAHFYTSTVDALITLGDRQSVSNAEDRWLRLKEAGWLLFNIALPYLRGPAAIAGWLVQLVSSLDSDFEVLRKGDEAQRAQAVVDLLFNLGTVFMHGAGEVGMARAAPVKVLPSMLQARLPVRGNLPVTGVLAPVQQPPGAPLRSVSALATAMDFSWSGMRSESSPQLRALMRKLQVSPGHEPPRVIETGTQRGLALIDGLPHVNLDGHWYRVLEVQGRFCIVDPLDSSRQGPWLRRAGNGGWQLDLRLGLRGGAPNKRLSLQEKKAQNKLQLQQLNANLETAQQDCFRRIEVMTPKVNELNALLDPMFKSQREYQLDRTATRLVAMKQARARAQVAEQALKGEQDAFIEVTQNLLRTTLQARETLKMADFYGHLRPADYTQSLNLNFRMNFQARLQLQAQYHSKQFKIALHDAWVENAFQVTLGDSAQPFSALLDANTQNEKYHLLALEQAEACDALAEEIRREPAVRASVDEIIRYGEAKRDELKVFSAQRIRTAYLEILGYMSLDTRIADATQRPFFKDLLLDPDIVAGVLSHEQLGIDAQEFTPQERIQVLREASHCYSRARAVAQYVGHLFAAVPGKDYLAAFVQTLDQLDASARSELDRLVEVPVVRAPVRPTRKRKVIVTRTRRVVVGRVRAASVNEPVPIVDVEDANHRIVASYREHGDDDWNPIKTVLPATPVGLKPRKALRSEARQVLDQVAPLTAKQQGFSGSGHQPADIVFPLQILADRLIRVADDFERHSDLPEAEQGTVAQLRKQAQGLRDEADALRLSMCKTQKPTARNLLYLWERKQLHIEFKAPRKALAAGDFIDEYEVRVAGGGKWYVHLHYPDQATPSAAFSKGHIKLEAQRTKGYADLLKEAKSTGIVGVIWRADLTPAFLKGWFPLRTLNAV
ncbi:dermonecrotic toxin domain-containing protein [Pseudomonas aegrilactucae]|uniref:Uncharacterized protein n=1 Tax=Pseudomonas aegrilactucae TaxID=2854028 RepID=A0A9Q2XML3_9PSED|nr:DUF6543 domain-containing protein [Pseudomonas aegrilactucae]MBV6289846.1 hypothetical protein [Pseudomonas aegrilactucae]